MTYRPIVLVHALGIGLGAAATAVQVLLAFTTGHTLERWGMVAFGLLVTSNSGARFWSEHRSDDGLRLTTEEFSALLAKLRELNAAGYSPGAEHLAHVLGWPVSRVRGAMRLFWRCGLLLAPPEG